MNATEDEQRCNADHRLLFRWSAEGLVIRCRTCKRDHLFSWHDIAQQQSKRQQPARVDIK